MISLSMKWLYLSFPSGCKSATTMMSMQLCNAGSSARAFENHASSSSGGPNCADQAVVTC